MLDTLAIVALHDVTIERLAVKVARHAGHRARYLAYGTCPAGGSVTLVGHAGFLIAASGLTTGTATAAALWDGPSGNGQYLTSWTEAQNVVSAAVIPTTLGLAFRTSLVLTPAPGAAGGAFARVEWYEHCRCAHGIDHLGGPSHEQGEDR